MIGFIFLYNEDFIKEKDFWLGDMVVVERVGDVIFYIVKVVEDFRDGSEDLIVFLKICFINSMDIFVELVWEGIEVVWCCFNCVCGVQDL